MQPKTLDELSVKIKKDIHIFFKILFYAILCIQNLEITILEEKKT